MSNKARSLHENCFIELQGGDAKCFKSNNGEKLNFKYSPTLKLKQVITLKSKRFFPKTNARFKKHITGNCSKNTLSTQSLSPTNY